MSAPLQDSGRTDGLPRVVLKPRRAQPFFGRHPWVFAGAISREDRDLQPGDEVHLVTHEGQYVATGLYNPASQIRVRLYAWNPDVRLDEAFWSARLDEAFALRQQLFGDRAADAAFRWVFSEADGLSGLTVDRFGDWLVVQLTSRALAARRELLVRLLQEKLQPRGLWLRTEKGTRDAEGLELRDGLLAGEAPPRPLVVTENGLQYEVDLVQGQKTGFFLDQRENRSAAARYVHGGRVLDAFCYSGGFGLNALRWGNAREVVAVDSSEAAVALTGANAERNGLADRMQVVRDDVFSALERFIDAGEQFDMVVLDPPRMARHRAGLSGAMRGYHSLNRLALDLLPPGGILVTCSCSGHVSRDDFHAMLAGAATQAGRHLQMLEDRGQAADHPVSVHCLENAYLKCAICRVV